MQPDQDQEPRALRIGCGAGFWGDSALGPEQLVLRGDIDFLVLDYLAEITMSILARLRKKRPDSGFATDFIEPVMARLARPIAERRVRVVTNAGGVNPIGCRDALQRVLEKAGVKLRIAVVTGDDVQDLLPGLRERGELDRERGGVLPAATLSANAYLGAFPIAEALRRGADIVITGRCVDSALVLGPLIAEFGWNAADYDRLAMGSLAGHVIECGTQATGGLFTDWREVERGFSDMGFPIVECQRDGSFVLTKPRDTSGLVAARSVAEQIVYEVHDPARYLLPDVSCDFTAIHLEEIGIDRVKVTGARGHAPPAEYKASLTHEDGYRLTTTLLLVGHEAAQKALRVGHAILDRVERILGEKGIAGFRERSVEVFGAEQSFGAVAQSQAREVVLKIAAAHDVEAALELLSREIAPAATSMVQSISGFAGGRPRVQPIVRLASCMVPKRELHPTIDFAGQRITLDDAEHAPSANSTPPAAPPSAPPSLAISDTRRIPLRWLAHGRSGDKGDTANIGIIARRPEYLPILRAVLTPEFVREFLAHFVRGAVRRYDWPGLFALNFVLEHALGGGGVASLRHDPQGKGLCQILLEAEIDVPAEIAARCTPR